jgi:uncharacterized protein YjbJ (UPF0337 family)
MVRRATKERNMNWDRVGGNWKQFKGKVKEQWGKLTDDDLDRINGQREQLAGKIQESYGIGKDEAERQLKDWETRIEKDRGH